MVYNGLMFIFLSKGYLFALHLFEGKHVAQRQQNTKHLEVLSFPYIEHRPILRASSFMFSFCGEPFHL